MGSGSRWRLLPVKEYGWLPKWETTSAVCKVKNQNALGTLFHPNKYPKALELNLGRVRDGTISAGLEQRPGAQMLLSGSSRLDDSRPGLRRRWSARLLWLSCCSRYWLSSAPTCSWSLKGLGRKLERNQSRYWEDRAKSPGEQMAEGSNYRSPQTQEILLTFSVWIWETNRRRKTQQNSEALAHHRSGRGYETFSQKRKSVDDTGSY